MHLEKTELDSLVMSTIYIPIVSPYNLFYMVKIVAKTWTPSALFHFFQQHSPLLSEAPRGLKRHISLQHQPPGVVRLVIKEQGGAPSFLAKVMGL